MMLSSNPAFGLEIGDWAQKMLKESHSIIIHPGKKIGSSRFT